MLEFVIGFVVFILLIFHFPKVPKNFPPGPYPFPIVGAFPYVDMNDVISIGPYLVKKFGPISGLVFPFLNTIALDNWEVIKEMFGNEDCQGRPDVTLIRDRFEGSINRGVLFTDGENHKQQRKFILHNFRHLGFGVGSHEGLIHDEAMELVKDFSTFEARPFEPEDLFYLTNINLTWAVLSSKSYKHSDPELKWLSSGIFMIMHDIGLVGSVANYMPFLKYIFPESTGYTSILKGSAIIRKAVNSTIKEHKQTRNPKEPRDFIDTYLDKIDREKENKDTHFTEEELLGVCMDFLLAGADTSTGMLRWIFLFLGLYQDIQEKVYTELIEVVGHDNPPTLDDRDKLIYCDAFLNEILRFRNVNPVYPPHSTLRETTLMGYTIPKDTIIFPDIRMVHMDKEYHGDPENFRPERYITEDGKLKKDERLLPFGKGKRSCLGEGLARMSNFLIYVTLVYHFKFTFPAGDKPTTTGKPGFTVTPYPYKIIATPRKQIST